MPMILIAALLLLAVPAGAQTVYVPGPENVALPADYQTRFVRYSMVDKAERKIIRFMYVNPAAFEALKKGEASPDGTILIMEDHAARLGPDGTPVLDQQGRFIPQPAILAIAVQEKRKGWGVGYPEAKRNGEWEYARFTAAGARNPATVENCFICHKARAAQDYNFTLWDYAEMRR
jgi:hypothetical protein